MTLREKECNECTNEICRCRDCRGGKKEINICIDACGFNEDRPCIWLSFQREKTDESDTETLDTREMPCLF